MKPDYSRFKTQLERIPADQGCRSDKRYNPLAINAYVAV